MVSRRHPFSGVLLFVITALWLACSARPPGPGEPDGGPPDGDGDANDGTGSTGTGSVGNDGGDDLGPVGTKCGDGKREGKELCDDGNQTAGDGCSDKCFLEPDWDCSVEGQPCVSVAGICGNGFVTSAEACDDGKEPADGDGCSADCKTIEPGWQCRVPGRACIPDCGDGTLLGNEQCDDGKAPADEDGCSSTCRIEPGWSCTGTPSVCTPAECGNMKVEVGESCDLGEKNGLFHGDGTGCSKTCTQEPTCRDAEGKTIACAPVCGNANVDEGEACDDGNAIAGDGCSDTCQLEEGFTCTPKDVSDLDDCGGTPCLRLPIKFRDFDHEGLATGHPDFYYMGSGSGTSTRNCVPNASGAEDPNPITASACWTSDSTDLCQGVAAAALGADGKPAPGATTTCKCRFTDWDTTGIAEGAGPGTKDASCDSGGSAQPARVEVSTAKVYDSAESFKQWFTDVPAVNTTTVGTLELLEVGANLYQFSSSIDDCLGGVCRSNDLDGSTVYDDIAAIGAGDQDELTSGFFPLEDSDRAKVCNLWPYWTNNPTCLASDSNGAATPDAQWDPAANDGNGNFVQPVQGIERNFYFTTEVRYLFRFNGGGTLNFFGDDDVFVFINGVLALDMGAPHERLSGAIELPAAAGGAAWTIEAVDPVTGATDERGSGMSPPLGLEVGKIYEIAVFHADRHPRESNYQLTISGFSTTKSECVPTCGNGAPQFEGDGIGTPTAGEECDLGMELNNGSYGGCTADCKFGPFCGDGTAQAEGGEECDNGTKGNNSPLYSPDAGGSPDGCTPSCKKAHFCGDGFVDASFGEQCDEGADNGIGECTIACVVGSK